MTVGLSSLAALLVFDGCCMTVVSGTALETGTGGQTETSGAASTGGASSTGAATSTGTSDGSTGGTSGGATGGTTGSLLPNGAPCDAGDNCSSGVCGDGYGGLCCAHACPHDSFFECASSGCSDAGTCLYPPAETTCASCTGSTLSAGVCDGLGSCINIVTSECPGNFACNGATRGFCDRSCEADSNCAEGFYCVQNGANRGKCFPEVDGG